MMTSLLSRLREMRAARARRRALWRELSTYTTADDLNDIEAAIARCDDPDADAETRVVRAFLASRRSLSPLG